MRYHEQGEGDPILFLHGFGGSSYSWRYVSKSFSGDHRVIAVDLKGFGLSDKPIDNRYSARDQSEIIVRFIEEEHLNGITLVGHSFGGAVALLTYLSLENRDKNPIRRLILIDAASYRQPLPGFISLLRTPCLGDLFLSLLPTSLNVKMVLKEAFHDDGKITDEMIKTYAGYLDLPGARHALIESAAQIIPEDIDQTTRDYRTIKVPVLLIWGERDSIVPLTIGEKLKKDIPQSVLIKIAGCGHIPQEECPEETISLIYSFIDQNSLIPQR